MIVKRIEASKLVSIEAEKTLSSTDSSKVADLLKTFAGELRKERLADLPEIEESLVNEELEEKLNKDTPSPEIVNVKCSTPGKYKTGQILKTKHGVVIVINSSVHEDGIDHLALSRFN